LTRKRNSGEIDITRWTPASAVRIGKNEAGEVTVFVKPAL
jgi:hypothetical protein